MSISLILLIIALLLAILSVAWPKPGLLAASVICVCVAMLIGGR